MLKPFIFPGFLICLLASAGAAATVRPAAELREVPSERFDGKSFDLTSSIVGRCTFDSDGYHIRLQSGAARLAEDFTGGITVYSIPSMPHEILVKDHFISNQDRLVLYRFGDSKVKSIALDHDPKDPFGSCGYEIDGLRAGWLILRELEWSGQAPPRDREVLFSLTSDTRKCKFGDWKKTAERVNSKAPSLAPISAPSTRPAAALREFPDVTYDGATFAATPKISGRVTMDDSGRQLFLQSGSEKDQMDFVRGITVFAWDHRPDEVIVQDAFASDEDRIVLFRFSTSLGAHAASQIVLEHHESRDYVHLQYDVIGLESHYLVLRESEWAGTDPPRERLVRFSLTSARKYCKFGAWKPSKS